MLSVHAERSGYPISDFDSFECFDVGELSNFVTKGVWSPIVWFGNSRREHNFAGVYWCALDYDEGLTKKEAQEVFRGYRYLLGPTKSDGIAKVSESGREKPACDRFRVVLPFAKPIFNFETLRYNMKLAASRFKTDLQATDAARVWQPCKSVEVLVAEGEALDVVDEIPLEETQDFKDKKVQSFLQKKRRGAGFPIRTQRFLSGKIKDGERNKELFIAACTLFTYGYKVSEVRALVEKIPGMAGHDKTESTIKSAARKTGADYY